MPPIVRSCTTVAVLIPIAAAFSGCSNFTRPSASLSYWEQQKQQDEAQFVQDRQRLYNIYCDTGYSDSQARQIAAQETTGTDPQSSDR